MTQGDKSRPDALVKFGVDEALEADANRLLAKGAKAKPTGKRKQQWDIEKLLYESGTPLDELSLYDPSNDWDTQDSAYTLPVDNIGPISASECNGGGVWEEDGDGNPVWVATDDGNSRARSREDPALPPGTWGRAGEEERRDLTGHVGDEDSWGSAGEYVPLLGANDITGGKTCARCQLRKRLEYFSPDRRGKQGRDNWCKLCRMEQRREKRRSGD